MGRNIVKMVDYHKGSGGQSDPALTLWLSGLPMTIREKLAAIGLLDRTRMVSMKTLAEHLDDFKAALAAKDGTDRHVELVTTRAKRIVRECGFKHYGDISASKVATYLAGLRGDAKEKRGISAQTSNFYLNALKQFCRWMVKDRRAFDTPIDHLDCLNVRLDRRHDRRALTTDELKRLLCAAREGRDRFGVSGEERALCYWLAVETGLRSGEIRSLTRASFVLDGDSPSVTVAAGYSKRRREDTLPLREDLTAALRAFLASRMPQAPAFRISGKHHVSKLLRFDLEAAGIIYRDDAGRVADFHSLRHTFISNLANGGVHPKTAQLLARHSTISLTMDRYTHSLVGEQSTALAVLPDLSQPSVYEVRATGTGGENGPEMGKSVLASCLALSERFQGTSVDSERPKGSVEPNPIKSENPVKDRGLATKTSGGGGIRTPERLSALSVFKTDAIGHSATPPCDIT